MAAAAAAVAVPGTLLVRAAEADVAVLASPEPSGTFRTIVSRAGGSGRMEVHVDPARARAAGDDARFFLRVLVAANRSRSSFALELRGEGGRPLRRCAFAPGDYRVDPYSQTALLACPVPEPAALRTVVFEATTPRTPASIRVRRRPDGRYEGGGLLAGTSGGAAAAVERLAVGRPRLLGPATMLVSLGLSSALLVAAAAAPAARRRGRPGG